MPLWESLGCLGSVGLIVFLIQVASKVQNGLILICIAHFLTSVLVVFCWKSLIFREYLDIYVDIG